MTSNNEEETRSCERCGDEIPAARVRALPGTWLCIDCSREVGGDFDYVATQENLGKAGSLKLNYGGVSVKKRRKKILPKKK